MAFFLLVATLCIYVCNSITNFTFGPLTIWLYASNIVRITHLPSHIINLASNNSSRIVSYIPSNDIPYNQTGNIITTNSLMITVNITNNYQVSFYDISDNSNSILSETSSQFISILDSALNNSTYIIQQEWEFTDNNTAFYGFGSYQNNFINFRDATIRCIQWNTEACVPFLLSNNYYGLIWDNYAITTLNYNYNTNNFTKYIFQNDSEWYNFTFQYTSNCIQDGYHHFFLNFTNEWIWGTPSHGTKFWVFAYKRLNDKQWIILNEHGPANNMPTSMSLPGLFLKIGETISININMANLTIIPIITVRGTTNNIDIYSSEGDYIDYYFIYNHNSLDDVISGYRMLTGSAPLYELKNYGFWQCQNKYHNQSEILYSASEFRAKGVPVDNIVQDWTYWGSSQNWGPQWDAQLYPYPKQMVNELHAMNFYFMVSVWPKYGTNTSFYKQMQTDNELIANTTQVDIYQQKAAQQFYEYANQGMFTIGVDALWLDATEPENYPQINNSLDIDILSGNAIFNTYSLYVTKSIHNGLSNDYPNKRIFTLTRSSFAAQQYTSGTLWTGDITYSWNCLHRQIVSSINYQLSGIPYWSQDIGAFNRPPNSYNDIEYRRMLIRWFQFGAFTPIFRSEGTAETAPWYYGGTVLAAVTLIDNLRYRLLPYIYSVAYYVDQFDYTLQRALILEFPNDANVKLIEDQYMFGPNMLISPVSNDNNITNVYLPKTEQYDFYYNFWNGSTVIAGKWYNNQYVQLSQISIYIPSGSIILMAPYLKWSNEIPWTPIEVRIYRGNDAYFILFEDDGVSKDSISTNQFTEIAFIWTDATNTLTINDRKGSYDQMLTERFFNIVLVTDNHGIGVNVTQNVDKIVSYVGQKVIVNF
eukprot:497323_1